LQLWIRAASGSTKELKYAKEKYAKEKYTKELKYAKIKMLCGEKKIVSE
jgi:hypothetical protein